jgi:hypothetical protein
MKPSICIPSSQFQLIKKHCDRHPETLSHLQQGSQGRQRTPVLDRRYEGACPRRPELRLRQPDPKPELTYASSQQRGERIVLPRWMLINT